MDVSDIFIFSSRGRGRGSPRRQEGGGGPFFLLKIPGGGGLPGEGGGGLRGLAHSTDHPTPPGCPGPHYGCPPSPSMKFMRIHVFLGDQGALKGTDLRGQTDFQMSGKEKFIEGEWAPEQGP